MTLTLIEPADPVARLAKELRAAWDEMDALDAARAPDRVQREANDRKDAIFRALAAARPTTEMGALLQLAFTIGLAHSDIEGGVGDPHGDLVRQQRALADLYRSARRALPALLRLPALADFKNALAPYTDAGRREHIGFGEWEDDGEDAS